MELTDYEKSFANVAFERNGGILVMRLHTDGGPLRWDLDVQRELGEAFRAVGTDLANRVIILTGTGDEFSGPRLDPDAHGFFHDADLTPSGAAFVFRNGRKLVMSMLDIEVPMIAIVNGPAKRHSDLALMCDIVIAADHATFEDTAHFHLGSVVPGDGISAIYTMLIGLNRARYMMLTGQVLTAAQALELGLVAEVMPAAELMGRAQALAAQLARKPDMLLRHTRRVLIDPLRKAMEQQLEHFLSLEFLAVLDRPKQ